MKVSERINSRTRGHPIETFKKQKVIGEQMERQHRWSKLTDI